MYKLMDLYKSIQNPLDDNDIIKKCIDLYTRTQKSGGSFYTELMEINSDNKPNRRIYNSFYEEVFSNWKMDTFRENIIKMTPERYAFLFGSKEGYYSEDFQLLKNFFTKTNELEVFKIGEETDIKNEIKKNSRLNDAFQKYGYDIFQSGWDYISFSEVLETKRIDTTHRLYISMDDFEKYKLIWLIIDEFNKNKVPLHFKYNCNGRDDTIVMWTDNDNLIKTIELLRKVKNENKELLENGIFEPPLLTGKIDNWIGYGSEPTTLIDNERTSFNKFRSIIIKNAITNVYEKYSSVYSEKLTASEIAENDAGFIQAVKDEIIRIGKKCGIDENNFCFDTQTVEQMKQADSKSKHDSQQPIPDVTIEETRYDEAIALADELLQKPGIDWEDLLQKEDEEQTISDEPSKQDLEELLEELNKLHENDEKRKVQKQKEAQKGWKSKFDKRDKDYYKKAETYLPGELKRLSPEERKRGNQYLSALENEQNRTK